MGNISFSPSYYERLDGFQLALRDLGLDVNPDWIVTDALEQSEYMMQTMKAIRTQPTAWFCVNDGLGFLANSTLHQLGFQVPDDVSVCSFENGQLSRLATPTTTTMAVDLNLFGRKAVEQFFWRMEHKVEPFMELLLPRSSSHENPPRHREAKKRY